MRTIDQLIERVEKDPTVHLGARSISALHAYILGYGAALEAGQLPALTGLIVPSAKYLPEPFSEMSVADYSLLQSEDEHEAFGFFLEWRRGLLLDLSSSGAPPGDFPPVKGAGLLEMLETVLGRPAMYLGSVRVTNLWALVRGFEWAEIDHGLQSLDVQRMRGFSTWVAERYRTPRPWFAVFRLMEVGSSLSEVEHFMAHLTMYLIGASPNAAYEHSENMLAVSLEQAIHLARKSADPVEGA